MEVVEWTNNFFPYPLFVEKKQFAKGGIIYKNIKDIKKQLFLNKTFNLMDIKKRFNEYTFNYSIKFKDNYYYFSEYSILKLIPISDTELLSTDLLMCIGSYYNDEIGANETVKLTHSSFDNSLLTKKIPKQFKGDLNKNIIINENLFNYMTKIRKDTSIYNLNKKIDLIKRVYIKGLEQQLEELNDEEE